MSASGSKISWMFGVGLLAAVAAYAPATHAAKSAQPPASKSTSARSTEWRYLGGNSDQWQHSGLTQINSGNVSRLGLAWFADLPAGDSLAGNPLVADGVVYQSAPPGRIFANDARTGKALWTFFPEMTISPNQSRTGFWSLHYNRGLALDANRLFVASNCRILAVDRLSGKQIWAAQSCDPTKEIGITGAPRVGGGKVFIGNSGGDKGRERGYVDAFDAETGKHLWRFYTMPGDPKQPFETPELAMAAKTWGTDYWKYTRGSNSPWDAITYDGKSDTLYFGTDGPSPWSPSDRAPDGGDELFSNCIIAVNASTGKYLWHYQTVPRDGWNLAATMHIMLADLPQAGGGTRRVVMTAPKNGFFYVLDAKTGKFISAKNFVPVNWASHIDPATGRPVRISDSNYWQRPGTSVLTLPGDVGGHNWELMAFDPASHLVYIPATISPIVVKLDPALLGGVDGDYEYGFRPDATVKTKGELLAWDPLTQTKRWSVDRTLPLNGGILATAGNLVFQGTGDGKFEAFAADSGKLLWSFDARSTIVAAPSTVEIDGVQLILVPVGNGGGSAMRAVPRLLNTERTLAPARLLAFRLDGKVQLPVAKPEKFPRPARPKQPADLAASGERVFLVANCAECHGARAQGSGPGIPDLRKLSAEKYGVFKHIVVEGALRPLGMPSFPDLTDEDLDALAAYLTNRAWERYEQH